MTGKTLGVSVKVNKSKMLNQTRRNRLRQSLVVGDNNLEIAENFCMSRRENNKGWKRGGRNMEKVILRNKAHFILPSIFTAKYIHYFLNCNLSLFTIRTRHIKVCV